MFVLYIAQLFLCQTSRLLPRASDGWPPYLRPEKRGGTVGKGRKRWKSAWPSRSAVLQEKHRLDPHRWT